MSAFPNDLETRERFKELLTHARSQNLEQFVSSHDESTNIVQLSAGPFSGTVLNADFQLISVQLERCNRDIEKEVCLGEDELVFTFCVHSDGAGVAGDGSPLQGDCVIVQAPRCRNVLILPSGSMQLTVKVRNSVFLENRFQSPEIRNWLKGSVGKVEFLRSRLFACRLGEVGSTALEISASEATPERLEEIARSLILSLVCPLVLEWLSKQLLPTYQRTQIFDCFRTARDILLEGSHKPSGSRSHAFNRLGSRRTVEKAFSKLTNMGPTMYARVLRLNNARRKILDDAYKGKSIVDIAAEEGFWDWSRFTAYYRKHFGELPSATRNKLLLSK